MGRNTRWTHLCLAVSHAQLGQRDNAQRHAKELLRLWPDFSLQSLLEFLPYKNKSDLDHFIDGLRKAGLSE